MIILGISSHQLGPNVRAVVLPVILFGIFITLTYLLITQGYSKLSLQNTNISKTQESIKILEDKAEVLEEITAVLDKTDDTTLAMPVSNPAAFYVSQLKKISTEDNVKITEITTRLENNSTAKKIDMNMAELTIELESESLPPLINTLTRIKSYTPISNIKDISIESKINTKVSFTATLITNVYWSDFPNKITKLSEPLDRLTPSDTNTLTWVGGLIKPDILILNPNAPSERENPFR